MYMYIYIYHQTYHILYIITSFLYHLYHIVTYAHILKKTNSTDPCLKTPSNKNTLNRGKTTSGLPNIINEGDIVRTRSFILNRQKGRGRPRFLSIQTKWILNKIRQKL